MFDSNAKINNLKNAITYISQLELSKVKMTNNQQKDFLKVLDQYKKQVTSSKEASRKFLIELGIVTEKGNLRKHYKHLCIPPPERD